MRSYIGIIEKEPGSLWGIWFPDLPGCISAAETSETLLTQVGEALEQWIDCAMEDGAPIPPASTLQEIRRDPEVADALAKGNAAIVVSLPLSRAEVSFDDRAIAAIDRAAAARGVTRVDFVRQAVLEKIAG